MYTFIFKGEVMESSANGRKKGTSLFSPPFYLRPLFFSDCPRSKHDAGRAIPLLDPGVLNCDVSRSLRGVDMLLESNAGSGDVSFPVELWWFGGGEGGRERGREGDQNKRYWRAETQPCD